jgi:FkbM family methyltransferase
VLIPIGFLNSVLRVKPDKVLHVGAHQAEESDLYKKYRWGDAITVWVEAQTTLSRELIRKLDPTNNDVINCLAWSIDGLEMEFHISSNSESSSVLPFGQHLDLYPKIRTMETIKLRTSRLDTVLPKNFQADLIVLDIQGSELEALKGLGLKLKSAKWIYSELSSREIYLKGPTVLELDTFLDKAGFKRVATKWYKNHGWGDALYVNESLRTSSRIFMMISKIYLGLIYTPKVWIVEKYHNCRGYLGSKIHEFL